MRLYYFDSSAIVKLVVTDQETDAITSLSSSDSLWLTSDLAVTEVQRACLRYSAQAMADAQEVLRHLATIQLTSDVYDKAGRLPSAYLRSLDAIHIAAAQTLGSELTAMVTYDKRLSDAAKQHGLRVVSPGAK